MTVASAGRVFHTLDLLRGIAAIGVVVYHLSQAFTPLGAPGGYLAVDLFFIMSGVVLTHVYEDKFRNGMGTLAFMRVRLIRLYPLYLLGTLFGATVTVASMLGHNSQHWTASSLWQAASLALLFLPSLSVSMPVHQLFPLDMPCWSLFFELLINLLFVMLWPLLTTRRLVAVVLLTGGALILAVLQKGTLDQGSNASSLAVGLMRTGFGFSVGILIARRIRNMRRAISSRKVYLIVAIVLIAVTARPDGLWGAIWDAVAVIVVLPFTVYYGTLIDPGVRVQKVATFLGVTSYAVYVLHSPLASVLRSLTRAFTHRGGEGVGAPYIGIALVPVLLIGCWLIDRYYDIPIRQYLSGLLPKVRTLRRARTQTR